MIISFSHYCVIRGNIKEKKREVKVTREMRQTKWRDKERKKRKEVTKTVIGIK